MASAYCPRCKKLFDTDEDVRTHLVDPEPCSFKQGDPPDGISVSMQKALKSRKATSQNLPQPERWKEIYRMLFPGHDVPEPCMCLLTNQPGFCPVCPYANLDARVWASPGLDRSRRF